jgi:hypothetical protein
MITATSNSKDKATADLMAQVAALQAENLKLKEARNKALSFKVSPKGCLSVYGLGRFPVSLFAGQWRRLIQVMPELEKFMADNKDKLSEKS